MFSTLWGLGNLVRCALEAQVSPDATKPSIGPALCLAALGNTSILKALLAGGANVELADNSGFTALATAAHFGQLSCLQLLLDAGANANAQDCLGKTPLMLAVMNKQVECARALLTASDLAATTHIGYSALHLAVTTASEACFQLLLPMYDVDVRTVPGVVPDTGQAMPHFRTPLHFACRRGSLPMCKALLSRGADRMARDSRLFTPLHYSAGNGHLSCVIMLVGRPGKVRMTPAEVDAVTDNRCTALHCAACGGFDQVCGVLIGGGARGWTRRQNTVSVTDGPLDLAQLGQPYNAALLSLLSGDIPAQLPGAACDHCGLTAEQASVRGLKSCGKCYATRYCSKECQLAAWPGHKAECKAKVKELEERSRPNFRPNF